VTKPSKNSSDKSGVRRGFKISAYELKPPRRGYFIQTYFVIGLAIIAVLMFTYSQLVINRLKEEYKKTSTAYAIVSSMLISSKVEEVTDKLASDIGETMNFPSILTDNEGNYIAGKNLGFEIDENDPQDLERVKELIAKMDSANDPIPIIRYHMNPNTHELMEQKAFLFHYQEPAVITLLKWLPVAQIALVIAFILIGVLTYRGLKRGEQSALWAGMAKETAHQLGTPTSSLFGWLELLRDVDYSALKKSDQELVKTALKEIGWDVNRLRRIAERFGSIGTRPTLRNADLVGCVRRAVDYYRTRFDFEAKGVAIAEKYPPQLVLPINIEQIGWCCENLLKNAVTAISGRSHSNIRISIEEDTNRDEALIKISDDGVGIPSSTLRHIFNPGFTTKRRGWGMGLSLVKRIVEEYHAGRIEVSSSEGIGTVFTLHLPLGRGKK